METLIHLAANDHGERDLLLMAFTTDWTLFRVAFAALWRRHG